MTVCSNYGAAISRVSTTHEGGLTEPGQNIWPMHHGWTGGKAAWEGTKALRGTVGLGTDVEIVTVGIPVVARVVAAWGIAWAKWANPTRAANVMDIIWAGKPRSVVQKSASSRFVEQERTNSHEPSSWCFYDDDRRSNTEEN